MSDAVNSTETVRIFVGGQSEHWLPTRVLEHSIRRHATGPVEIVPLSAWNHLLREPADPHNRPATSFSLQRFLPPEICGHMGRAIYIDSDMIVRADIRELWETPMHGVRVLICPGWQSAVMLMDCGKCDWTVDRLVRDMDAGRRSIGATMNLKGLKGVEQWLDPLWNCIDRPELPRLRKLAERGAKLLHYTSMNHQPWLRAGHPCETYWFQELYHAIEAGAVTPQDIWREARAGHVRPSLVHVIGDKAERPDSDFTPPNDKRLRNYKAQLDYQNTVAMCGGTPPSDIVQPKWVD